MNLLPTLADVREAHQRIAPHVHRTPVITCPELDEIAGCELLFKCENMQRSGAFKFRGALNAVLSLADDEAERGVVTHSSGNHGAALALAARLRGIPVHVVVPANSNPVKIRNIERVGGRVVPCEPTQESRESTALGVVAETGAVFVHPYDDRRVIAGQGTAAVELIEDHPDLSAIVVPVGGGGLLSGTAIATVGLSEGTRVIAGEPAQADDACRSLEAGSIQPSLDPTTIADGLLTSLSDLTFAVIREHVTAIVRVQESQIVDSMRLLWNTAKLVVEPSSATALAAVIAEPERFSGRRVGVILTGGNVDLERLPF